MSKLQNCISDLLREYSVRNEQVLLVEVLPKKFENLCLRLSFEGIRDWRMLSQFCACDFAEQR